MIWQNGIVIGSTTINDGNWHHVACTLSGGAKANAADIKLYVDGIKETLSTVTPLDLNTGVSGFVKIGSDVQNRFWEGSIQHARIYTRALSDDEIQAEAAQTNPAALAWHYRYYGTSTANWLANTDNDQLNSLLEYALGGQPQVPSPGLSPDFDALGFSFQRLLQGTSELSYDVQASTDLQSWTLPVELLSTSTITVNGTAMEKVTYRLISPSAPERVYYRLSVGLP